MKRRIVYMLVSLMIAALLGRPYMAAQVRAAEAAGLPDLSQYQPRLMINGTYATTAPIQMTDGSVLTPLRILLETAGYDVAWEAESNTVIVQDGILKLHLKTGAVENNESKAENIYKLEVREGTTFIEAAFFAEIKDISALWDPATKTVNAFTANAGTGDVIGFHLGTTTMHTSLDKDLTYALNGSMAIPETEGNPLVIFLHGAHAIETSEENRYDLGFSYLMKALAAQGYFSMSINANIQYSMEDGEPIESERMLHLVDAHMKRLVKANAGIDMGYPVDLTGKIDLSNVILVGHSRSGQEIFHLKDVLQQYEGVHVNGLLGIAPSVLWEMDYIDNDIPVSIILPEMDGDVVSLDGQQIFDRLLTDENRTAQAQLVYLYKANHNAFNTALLKQDVGKTWHPGDRSIMDGKQQREFMLQYMLSFADAVVNQKPLTAITGDASDSLFGCKAMVSNYVPGTMLYRAGYGDAKVVSNGLNAKELIYSYIPIKNEAGFFNHPGVGEEMPLLRMQWEDKNGTVTIMPKRGTWNLSKAAYLNLYIAQDSSDAKNNGEDQSIEILLRAKDQTSKTVRIPKGSPYLAAQDGVLSQDGTFFTAPTPLGILRIPLNMFEDITQHEIEALELKYNQTDGGSIMLSFISVSP